MVVKAGGFAQLPPLSARAQAPLQRPAPALGRTGFSLDSEGVAALRTPRLSQALLDLKHAGLDCEDFRKVSISALQSAFGERGPSEAPVASSSAVFAGVAQACASGSYWAPEHGVPGADLVDCKHLVRPVSCWYERGRRPERRRPSWPGTPVLSAEAAVCEEVLRHPLDVAARLLSSHPGCHVAVVRFTSAADFRNASLRQMHRCDDQVLLRTSYGQALERMERELQMPAVAALERGLIYTSDVGLLRGPVQDGAPWLRSPLKLDVIWITVPSFPGRGAAKHELEEWYAEERDGNEMRETLDHAFACAVARGCEALVLPPIGCSSHACLHPPLGVASAIHEVAQRYRGDLRVVRVASDCPAHFRGSWWERFAAVLRSGGPRPEAAVPVPPLPAPPWVLSRKAAKAVQERRAAVAAAAKAQEEASTWRECVLALRRPGQQCTLLASGPRVPAPSSCRREPAAICGR